MAGKLGIYLLVLLARLKVGISLLGPFYNLRLVLKPSL
jgi:hypothetical protein